MGTKEKVGNVLPALASPPAPGAAGGDGQRRSYSSSYPTSTCPCVLVSVRAEGRPLSLQGSHAAQPGSQLCLLGPSNEFILSALRSCRPLEEPIAGAPCCPRLIPDCFPKDACLK